MTDKVEKMQAEFQSHDDHGKFAFVEKLLQSVQNTNEGDMHTFSCKCCDRLSDVYENGDVSFKKQHANIYALLTAASTMNKATKESLAAVQYSLGYLYTQDETDGFPERGAPEYDKTAHWWDKAANNGHYNAKNKLSALHLMVSFPGANPQKGMSMLVELAVPPNYGDMLELGVHYLEGTKIPQDTNKARELLEQGVKGYTESGEPIPFRYCFKVGMDAAALKETKMMQIRKTMLEKILNDAEDMKRLEKMGGHQLVMMVKEMLHHVKGWLNPL
jgi:hypothetical protein